MRIALLCNTGQLRFDITCAVIAGQQNDDLTGIKAGRNIQIKGGGRWQNSVLVSAETFCPDFPPDAIVDAGSALLAGDVLDQDSRDRQV